MKSSANDIEISVQKASGSKCERCYAVIRDGITSGAIAWANDGYYWTDMRPHCDDYDYLPMPEFPEYWREKYDYPPKSRDLSEYDRQYLEGMRSP